MINLTMIIGERTIRIGGPFLYCTGVACVFELMSPIE
jgi:hypothetical protein